MHAHKGGEADHGGPVRPNNLKIDERNQVRNGTDRKTLMKMSFIFESLQLTKWRSSTARTGQSRTTSTIYVFVCSNPMLQNKSTANKWI